MDIHSNQTKPDGKLFLWKFRPENQNYIGWNLSGDARGCIFLIELLEQMQTSSAPAHQTLITEPATVDQVKAMTGSKPFKTVHQLTLQYAKGEPQLWRTEEGNDRVLLSIGEREIDLLQTALFRIMKGEHDFAIGDANDEQLLYFWSYTAEE